MYTARTRTGFGFNLHRTHILPESTEKLRKLLSMVPDYEEEILGPISQQTSIDDLTAYDLLQSINPDSHLLALAEILSEVIFRLEGVRLIAAVDFNNSDEVILAHSTDGMTFIQGWAIQQRMNPIFQKYLSIITPLPFFPTHISWAEECLPRREFKVDTPFGKIHAYAKYAIDDPEDYPGVAIEFIDRNGTRYYLGTVEFDSCSERLQTVVYDDALSDEPSGVFVHKNITVDQYSRAIELLNKFVESECKSSLEEEDLAAPEKIPVIYTSYANDTRFDIQVYADLVNYKLLTYIQLPTEEHNDVLIREWKFDSLYDMNRLCLNKLDQDDLFYFTDAEWFSACRHPDFKRCLAELYRIGSTVMVGHPSYGGYSATVTGHTDDGRIQFKAQDGHLDFLDFGVDEFYPLNENAA